MGLYKYNIENLEWQQFELLSFKCLQFDISKSLQPIEGGNDKGREFIYNGVTNFFSSDNKEQSYIFQSKHKSTLDFKALKNDLKRELFKVYIKNKLTSSIYCLVTNISLSGNEYDELKDIFETFLSENELDFDLTFKIYSYRHFESCIDNNSQLKFLFPTIVKNTDFKFLLDEILNKREINNSKSFINIFKRNREKFVNTSIFDEALNKLEKNHILLLSGPPKSGKTFTAEMVIFNKYFSEEFSPYNIIEIQDFDKFYNKDKKQIFLFDDTFGKYDLDFNRADIINRKIEFLFDLVDVNHKFIFTSREYIFRAFTNYTDSDVKTMIERINVDVNRLSKYEKESIFLRYYKRLTNKNETNVNVDNLIDNSNFTPEVIRSYFENNEDYIHSDFIKHIKFPDAYLKKIFINLNEKNKILLLSILLSSNQKINSIAYSNKYICEDLRKPIELTSIEEELELLNGSLINDVHDRYSFYHPTMAEFFIKYINEDVLAYRNILFKNINVDLLFISSFNSKTEKNNIVIQDDDIKHLEIGLRRFILNPNVDLNSINGIFSWFNETDRLLFFKLKNKIKYKEIIDEILASVITLDLSLFAKNINEDVLAVFFKNVKRLYVKKHSEYENIFNQDKLQDIIKSNKNKDRFWYLVFSLVPFIKDEIIFDDNYIGRNWLNNFYSELKSDINTLGAELYGNAYPDFIEPNKYKKLMDEKKFDEANKIKKKSKADFKLKTNNTWYKRYAICKEKIMVIKANHPIGYKIYEKLIPLFSHLSALEDNQKNRYIFNKKKKWW